MKEAGFKLILLRSTKTNYRGSIVWNWGWGGGHPIYADTYLNNPDLLSETTVRGTMRMFSELMPVVSTSWEDIDSRYIIGKNNGHKGRGKLVFEKDNPPHNVNEFQVYQEFIEPPREEYRVLLCGDENVITYRKEIPDPFNPETEKIFHCCNGRQYGIRTREPEEPDIVKVIAEEVIDRKQLDVVGIDVIVKDDNGYLIETNSAPGIGPTTATKVMQSIQNQWGN
jgi:predicted ATP-grasp superfamily ATP-dependent carboligase